MFGCFTPICGRHAMVIFGLRIAAGGVCQGKKCQQDKELTSFWGQSLLNLFTLNGSILVSES
jgi:hypothetical protein